MNSPNGQVKAVGRGRGPWRAVPDQNTELRRPQGSLSPPSEPTSSDNTNKDEVSDVLAIAMKSTLSVNAKEFCSNLSADAKEFVPKFVSTAVPSYSQSYASDSSNLYDDYEQAEEDGSDLSPEECAILHLNDVINKLSCDPGKFDLLAKPIVDELSPMLAVEEIVENAAMLIIDQAITDRNFRYSGARLCKLLSKVRVKRSSGESYVFRGILLTKLNEEHDRIESNLDKEPMKVYGFIQFLAELYMQLEVENDQGVGIRLSILGDGLSMALMTLIRKPTVDNIKNACDILKLTGRLLDADQPDMNSFFSDLQKLLDDENTSTRAKNMISNILKLRKDMWGHAVSVESIPSALADSEQQLSDGVYYGPDHLALTAEEFKFLNESCDREETVSVGDDSTVWDPNMNEDENAEIMAAFNEFVNHRPRH